MTNPPKYYPVYTTRGDTGGYLGYPYIFNLSGEWIGWVTPDRQVYSVHGQYVGYLADGPRVLRKASTAFDQPRRQPPSTPKRVILPARAALPPLMSELPSGVMDVLEENPDLLPTLDTGEREDMD